MTVRYPIGSASAHTQSIRIQSPWAASEQSLSPSSAFQSDQKNLDQVVPATAPHFDPPRKKRGRLAGGVPLATGASKAHTGATRVPPARARPQVGFAHQRSGPESFTERLGTTALMGRRVTCVTRRHGDGL